MKKEKIREALKQDLFAKDGTYVGILNAIGDLENSFGNREKEIKELVFEDQEAWRGFVVLASGCALLMAYQWEADERHSYRPHWDERNAASQEFCHNCQSLFEDIFREYSGRSFPYRKNMTYERGLLYDTTLSYESDFYRELEDFNIQHHTIQQKMIGTFCRILGENGIYPDLLADKYFPFI